MRFNIILQLILLAITTASFQGLLNAHEWKDKSGRYRVEAELVSANKELVVLRTEDHRLIALDIVHLSDENQAFVHSKLEKSIKGSVAIGAGNPLVPIDMTVIPAEPLPTNVAGTHLQAVVRYCGIVSPDRVYKVPTGGGVVNSFVHWISKYLVVRY